MSDSSVLANNIVTHILAASSEHDAGLLTTHVDSRLHLNYYKFSKVTDTIL